jgi:hypothetical protein
MGLQGRPHRGDRAAGRDGESVGVPGLLVPPGLDDHADTLESSSRAARTRARPTGCTATNAREKRRSSVPPVAPGVGHALSFISSSIETMSHQDQSLKHVLRRDIQEARDHHLLSFLNGES